jgi:hypothetical protein
MIPKSLHTVSVLLAVAKLLRSHLTGLTSCDYVDIAASSLGYADADDVYGLKAAAVRKLERAS